MNNAILKAFKEIPFKRIIKIAHEIQKAIPSDPSLVSQKEKNETVTKADLLIQELILDHFSNSALAGNYLINAEEKLNLRDINANLNSKNWQLIVDPLDGTSAFSEGGKTWGTMVGLCDRYGKLIYAWNMVSSGEIFESSCDGEALILNHHNSDSLRIDVDNYGAGARDSFAPMLERLSDGQYAASNISTTAFPAAVWTGWQLFNHNLDALLWLPSDKGKRFYPEYDLIFLGALKKQGWQITLGKFENKIQMVAVASSTEVLELICKTGSQLIDPIMAQKLVYTSQLLLASDTSNRE